MLSIGILTPVAVKDGQIQAYTYSNVAEAHHCRQSGEANSQVNEGQS